MKNIKLIYFFVIIFLITSCNKRDSIIIGYQEISLYQHIFVAQEKGFFKDEGLDVKLKSFASGNQMMEAFLSNHIEVLGLANTQVALTVEGKDSGKMRFVNFLVWETNAYPDYILVKKSSKISNMNDLEGKVIGLHPGSAVKAFSRTVFQHYGLDESKIKTMELAPEVMQSALLAGRVDGLYCMDPSATTLFLTGECDTLISNPMQYIFPAPTPISGTVISSKLLKNPNTVQKLVRAIDRAIEYTRESNYEQEIAEYIAKYTPIDKEFVFKMNPSKYWKYEEIEKDRVQSLADKFYELGIVEKKINVLPMILQINE